jgi:hypothetical protein
MINVTEQCDKKLLFFPFLSSNDNIKVWTYFIIEYMRLQN